MGLVLLVIGMLVATVLIGWFAYSGMEFEGVGVTIVVALCLLVTTGVGTLNWATTYRGERWETCHVTGKDRGGNSGGYRIYTSNCDTLADEDSILRGKYNSSNVWQKIPNKATCSCSSSGRGSRSCRSSRTFWTRGLSAKLDPCGICTTFQEL